MKSIAWVSLLRATQGNDWVGVNAMNLGWTEGSPPVSSNQLYIIWIGAATKSSKYFMLLQILWVLSARPQIHCLKNKVVGH